MTTLRNTALALAATLAISSAHAASYSFTGQIETGPALGQIFDGQFSYNETQLSGSSYELLDLSNWTLHALGKTYTSTSVEALVVPQAAFYDGVFVGISASYASAAGGVALVDGYADFSAAYLAYETPVGNGFGSYSISAVPESSSWALGLVGLAVLGGVLRRRSRATV